MAANPSLDYVDVPTDDFLPGGVSQHPPEPLTRLINMYILSGLPVEALLGVLHPEPETVDIEQLKLHIHGKSYGKGGRRPGLEGEARSIGRLIRGGTSREKGGRSTGELSPIEEEARDYIHLRRQNGIPDEKILQELREGYGFKKGVLYEPKGETEIPVHTWPDMTMDDLKRLGGFGLPS